MGTVHYGCCATCPKNHVFCIQMDAEGYVHLNIIGRFNRVRALTQDVELIKEVNPANFPVASVFMVMHTFPVYSQWPIVRWWRCIAMVTVSGREKDGTTGSQQETIQVNSYPHTQRNI